MALITNLDTAPLKGLVPDYNRRSYGISIASFVRPANTTAYAQRDVIGTTASAALEFPSCGKEDSAGGSVIKALITIDANIVASFDLALWLFYTEPTNHADNALLALADAINPFGYLSLTNANRLVSNAASSPAGQLTYRSIIDLDQPFVCAAGSRSIYGLLVTETAFTPVSAMKIKIVLGIERD